jgi:hypothetical protein
LMLLSNRHLKPPGGAFLCNVGRSDEYKKRVPLGHTR